MPIFRRTAARELSAPKLTVSAYTSRTLRFLWFLAGLGLGLVLAAAVAFGVLRWIAQSRDAKVAALSSEIEEADAVRSRLQALMGDHAGARAELDRLQGLVDAADSRIRVERASAAQMASQLRTLEAQNIRLKSELIYLESLLPSSESEGMLEIRGLQLLPDAVPAQMRWRAMLVLGGRKAHRFGGSLQLLVKYELAGKPASLVLPKRNADNSDMPSKVSFERYQRVEGRFAVPEGATLKSVQLRVLRAGAVVAQQQLTL